MRIIFLFFSLISFAEASVVIVKFQNQKYEIVHEEKSINLKGHLIDLSLSFKNCNKHIIKKFNSRLDFILSNSKPIDSTIFKDEVLTLTIDSKSNQYASNSAEGIYFLSLVDEFKTMKLEEMFSCNK